MRSVKTKRLFCLTIFVALMGLFSNVAAQTFEEARNYAFNGEREKAREICREILSQDFNSDVALLMGRTYAWDGMYDSARVVLKNVLALQLDNEEAVNALIDVESWDGQIDSVLHYSNYGLSFHKNNERFLLKKAEALAKLEQDDKAKIALRQLLAINPLNEEALKLKKEINNWSDRKISLQHTFEFFNEPWTRRWHMTSLEYSQGTSLGSIIPRINIGDIVKDDEHLYEREHSYQFEIDFYPSISKSKYAYLSYGYSSMGLFPKHRAGAEIYQKLPKSFECSLGARYLQFHSSSGTKNIFILTGSIGKYYKNYWFSIKPFITPKSYGISQSYNLYIRRYFKSADNYFSFSVGTGTSPDDPANNVGNIERYSNKSFKSKIGYEDLFLEKLIWKIQFGYGYEEYKADNFRNTIDFTFKLSYLL